MQVQQERIDGVLQLRLLGDCSIYHAAELRGVLLDALASAEHLDLNLAGVSEFDTAGLQVLMAAKAQAQAQGRRLELSQHSAAVLALIELFELASWLGDLLIVPASPTAAAA